MLKVLAFYSAYTQSANSRRTGRPVVETKTDFFRSMATWPGPVADTVAKWPHACLSARHKATNAPTDRPPLFETSRSRSAVFCAAPRGTREERFGRQVRRRQNKCPPPPLLPADLESFRGLAFASGGQKGGPVVSRSIFARVWVGSMVRVDNHGEKRARVFGRVQQRGSRRPVRGSNP